MINLWALVIETEDKREFCGLFNYKESALEKGLELLDYKEKPIKLQEGINSFEFYTIDWASYKDDPNYAYRPVYHRVSMFCVNEAVILNTDLLSSTLHIDKQSILDYSEKLLGVTI